MSREQLDQVLPLMEMCQFAVDHVIFEQGQKAEYLYVLLKGEVVIRYKPYDGPPLVIARIKPGGVFGWSSALGRETYTSAAVATLESIAYRISARQVAWLCELFPRTGVILLQRLANVISQGLADTQSQVFEMLSQGIFMRSQNRNGKKD
ncbi:MAG: cyclic nucleotide-binding domain-containing protein [Anaerolineaceae bacterium]|nr:cyclic nucleotide-binding domain-containing protein [Anaerolineaceae bacterium]